jgi:hypothetical protein
MIIPREGSRFKHALPERCASAPRNLGGLQPYVCTFFSPAREATIRVATRMWVDETPGAAIVACWGCVVMHRRTLSRITVHGVSGNSPPRGDANYA